MSNPAKIKRNIIKVVKIVIKQKIIGISLNYSNPYFYFNELLFYYIIRFFVQFILSHQLTIFHFVLQVLMLSLFHLDDLFYHQQQNLLRIYLLNKLF